MQRWDLTALWGWHHRLCNTESGDEVFLSWIEAQRRTWLVRVLHV